MTVAKTTFSLAALWEAVKLATLGRRASRKWANGLPDACTGGLQVVLDDSRKAGVSGSSLETVRPIGERVPPAG